MSALPGRPICPDCPRHCYADRRCTCSRDCQHPRPSADRVDVWISGAAYSAAFSGGWPNENERGARDLETGQTRRRGRGTQHRATLLRVDAVDLAQYLASCADVLGSMTSEERGSDRPSTLWRACDLLTDAAGVPALERDLVG